MKTLHVVPGLLQRWNGIAGAAKDVAKSQNADVVETMEFAKGRVAFGGYDEVWVHSNWWPPTLVACVRVILAKKPLVRMTHANLDPLRLRSKWLKKFAVSFLERWIFRRTSRVVVTCAAEMEWCKAWGVKAPFEILDLRRFYDLSRPVEFPRRENPPRPIRVLYLGRRHPLKGVKYLERAVAELNGDDGGRMELKIVSDSYGDDLEKIWRWADLLCLPTLSENFGRVVAEALERGKPAVTTDGAPAWADLDDSRGRYLKGFVAADDAGRVRMLKAALASFL